MASETSKAVEACTPDRKVGGRSPNISEELRGHAIAPSGGVPLRRAYMLRLSPLSTREKLKAGGKIPGKDSVAVPTHMGTHSQNRNAAKTQQRRGFPSSGPNHKERRDLARVREATTSAAGISAASRSRN
jgi:hypothetical protein